MCGAATMFARIDNFLANHSPAWYRAPSVQTATLGVVFFWVFAAYTTIQFYAASTYGPDLAADSVSAVYFCFTVTCLIAPSVTNKFGCRVTMFFGVLAYASLVLNSLIYFLYGGEDVRWSRRMVVVGGGILGCGASLLWTSQGRLILQYASKAEELRVLEEQDGVLNKSKTQTGRLMGLFWSIFQCSALVGGGVSFLYFNKKPEGSAALYCLFLAFILIGALFTQLLLPPSMLKTSGSTVSFNRTKSPSYSSLDLAERTPLYCNVDSGGQYTGEETEVSIPVVVADLSHQSWSEEARGTFYLFISKRMGCLLLLFFYTGFNQPYQQATFGNRFFTRRTIGAELIIFHLMEILGAIVIGRFLDDDKVSENYSHNKSFSKKTRARLCLGSFIVINSIGNILAAIQEYNAKHALTPTAHDILSVGVIPPSMAFACWGFADAQIQVYCYWLLGGFYSSGHDHARAVGVYKLAQSLGTSIGFFLIPVSRLGELSQLLCSTLVFVVGTGLSFQSTFFL
ncbi:hypothetical protein HJC23_009512 [Cyclotella cryptica]|uniref:Uncharacterized protein n=1 Tax=Cyclotella cryptica TaxID=29204 RepID=A0ABD3Q4G1_9STRA